MGSDDMPLGGGAAKLLLYWKTEVELAMETMTPR